MQSGDLGHPLRGGPERVGEVRPHLVDEEPELDGTEHGERVHVCDRDTCVPHVGSELPMARSLEELAVAGFGAATFWVLEGNLRARRFYEAGGWQADGSTKVDHHHHLGFPIHEVRYRRELC